MTTQELKETHRLNSKKAEEERQGGAHPAVEPSGPTETGGDNPGTAGPGPTAVKSKTPENSAGHINPSAPEDANVTPGSVGEK